MPAAASAGGCSISMNPNPGWRGANVTFTGSGFQANEGYYVNLGGNQIKTGTTSPSGGFSFTYQIPNNFPVGTTNVFAAQDNGECETNPSYTVNASPPTTTAATTTTIATTTTTITTTTTTTTATTTTTVPATTSVATTTTVTSTTLGATTTSLAGETTTTTVVDQGTDGGGLTATAIVLIIIGVILLTAATIGVIRIRRS